MPSTVIRSFNYDATKQELHIVFQSGRRYTYLDVPAKTFRAMQASFAKGVFFNRDVRERYRFVPSQRQDADSE